MSLAWSIKIELSKALWCIDPSWAPHLLENIWEEIYSADQNNSFFSFMFTSLKKKSDNGGLNLFTPPLHWTSSIRMCKGYRTQGKQGTSWSGFVFRRVDWWKVGKCISFNATQQQQQKQQRLSLWRPPLQQQPQLQSQSSPIVSKKRTLPNPFQVVNLVDIFQLNHKAHSH